MTDVKSIEKADASLGRDLLYAARYYLRNRWVLLVLGSAVFIGGAALNWGWLVAIGLAPILLSLAPCAIMCAVGLCAMGGNKQSDQPGNAAEAAQSSAALGVAKMERSSVAGSGCCHEQAGDIQSPDVKQIQLIEERKDSHA